MTDEAGHQGWLLGGPLSPIGWSVGFIQAPLKTVADAIEHWLRDLGRWYKLTQPGGYPDCLHGLAPLQTPPKRELLIGMDGWTAHLSNSIDGGDSVSTVGHITRTLNTHGVLATHKPITKVGHAATNFQLLGPTGEPPLHYIRVLAAHAEDGRWIWDEHGRPLPFEDTSHYRRRLKRDRLTRPILITYLAALGLHVDDPAAFHDSLLIQNRAFWRSRTLTPQQARDYWNLT
jgi:hypothetical protein